MSHNTDQILKKWLDRYGIASPSELRDLRKNKFEISCLFPAQSLRIVSLIMSIFVHGRYLADEDVLVCISARDQWSEDFEMLGNRMISLLLNRNVVDEKIVVSLFHKDKKMDLATFVLSCSIFQWDVYILPETNGPFIFINHDGLIQIYTLDRNQSELIRQELDHWNPAVKSV